ncbi:hypothetical protein EK21DRAFT_53576 [Setomelanomma holmii]|uniref:Uncharacterized protein n=1 Tax=Setomelanomma holmii TaxID=210430 RepID=A0A9P4HK06_9PLEO|nr:hypothetical protein EK21DRAFT_53576 [Setomelanomma holmii]
MASVAPPRRFKVEPVETTKSFSKDRHTGDQKENSKPVRRFAPEPVETSTKTNRIFAPQPVETSQRTNRKFAAEPLETTSRTNRRFAPEPIETSQKTNRRSSPETTDSKTRRSPSRQRFTEEWDQQVSPPKARPDPFAAASCSNQKPKPALKRPASRFSPQLIETAQRSRKANDNAPALFPSDKTDATPDVISPRRARILGITPTPPMNSPNIDISQNPLFLEIQQGHASCPLARRRSYFSSSQHSFRVPDLDTIESSESEASAPPSPTTSAFETPDHSFMYTEVTRRRESVDARSSGYLLELAAKAAERQLREQAMAAFPNNDYHEPVAHYVNEDLESTSGDSKEERGASFTEINWELDAMQKFQEKKNVEKEKQQQTDQTSACHLQKKPAYNPFGNPAGYLDPATARKFAQDARDPELERMRKGARPPMLGKDIKFPRCESPEPSRFDPTQGCDAVKTAMCYLSEQSKAASEKGESLWCGKGNGRQTSTTPSLWSNANSRASNFSGIDQKLAIEQTIADDFSDDFVTQVYNYLSLGYPSMARPFDDELSKISQIPIVELRQDDHLAESRGYIRLGKDGNLADTMITEETCMRWRALRIYIQEWARQHPNMAEEEFPIGGRGTAVRKGSWAL